MAQLKCATCGEFTVRNTDVKTFTCKHCKTKNIVGETPEPREMTPDEASTSLVNVLDNAQTSPLGEKPRDVNFKVEANTVNFVKSPDAEKVEGTKSTTAAIPVTPGKAPVAEVVAWEAETIEPFFALIDETMVSMSNSEIWNVSKRTEKKLAQLWADVGNAYAPKADSKKIKLGLAITATAGTYAYQSKRYYDALQEKKRRNKGMKPEETPKEIKTDPKEMTEKEIGQAMAPPSPDNDFASKWKAKTGG